MGCTSEEIEQVVQVFQRATEANRQTPHRRGNVIHLAPENAEEVMVTADLHGNQENFAALLRVAALDANPARHLVLQEVCHGGPAYPNCNGCQSHVLLEHVALLKSKYPDRIHFILSNHELAELTDFPIVKGQKMLNLTFRSGLQQAYGEELSRVREAQLEFLRSSPLAVRLPGDILITHSLPNDVPNLGFDATIFERELGEEDYREQSSLFRLVWGRDYRPANAEAFAQVVQAKVLIHGHDPCPQGFKIPNKLQIILDCCGKPATYLMIPTRTPLDHAQLVKRIRFL